MESCIIAQRARRKGPTAACGLATSLGEQPVCGIVGFLDKRGGHERPVGRTILAMLQALSCRGPDSAGVALFGPPRGGCVMRVKLPEHTTPAAGAAAVLQALRDTGAVLRHTV